MPFFYGWVVVAVAFVTMALGVNARTTFSLLFPPILDEFGWPRGVTAGAFSFGFLVSGFSVGSGQEEDGHHPATALLDHFIRPAPVSAGGMVRPRALAVLRPYGRTGLPNYFPVRK